MMTTPRDRNRSIIGGVFGLADLPTEVSSRPSFRPPFLHPSVLRISGLAEVMRAIIMSSVAGLGFPIVPAIAQPQPMEGA